MRSLLFTLSFLVITLISFTPMASAEDTDIVITVKSRDAKFIGTEVGGAHVMIKNRLTGDVLADGTTFGHNGSTDTIMADSTERKATLTNEGSARFHFSIEFWEPIPVTIYATAPMGQQQSTVTVAEDMLLLPGKDYASGNGIMLEIPGFSVNIAEPVPNTKLKHNPETPITIQANVMKLCGSKVEKGSPWDPEDYKVEAHIYKDSLYIASFDLPYADSPGIYGQNLKIPLPGTYRLMVTVFDEKTKESGMDMTTVILEE